MLSTYIDIKFRSNKSKFEENWNYKHCLDLTSGQKFVIVRNSFQFGRLRIMGRTKSAGPGPTTMAPLFFKSPTCKAPSNSKQPLESLSRTPLPNAGEGVPTSNSSMPLKLNYRISEALHFVWW